MKKEEFEELIALLSAAANIDTDKCSDCNNKCKTAFDAFMNTHADEITQMLKYGLEHEQTSTTKCDDKPEPETETDNKSCEIPSNTYVIPVVGFIKVKDVPNEEIAIAIANQSIEQVTFTTDNLIDGVNEIKEATADYKAGHIPEDVIVGTCLVHAVKID